MRPQVAAREAVTVGVLREPGGEVFPVVGVGVAVRGSEEPHLLGQAGWRLGAFVVAPAEPVDEVAQPALQRRQPSHAFRKKRTAS